MQSSSSFWSAPLCETCVSADIEQGDEKKRKMSRWSGARWQAVIILVALLVFFCVTATAFSLSNQLSERRIARESRKHVSSRGIGADFFSKSHRSGSGHEHKKTPAYVGYLSLSLSLSSSVLHT